ncbi:MAG: DUF2723 domain-containing protein [bacterium]|nr:DUF2723 domain-containing protein [bacterium]
MAQIENNSIQPAGPFSRAARAAGAALAVVSLAVFIAALPQDLVWGDGPELAAAAWSLGIPHPTGYSLYVLLLHAFSWLPLGTAVFRGHLFSAVCMALAAWAMFELLRGALARAYGESFWLSGLPAMWAAAAFLCTPVAWDAAVQIEVYALFVLLYALNLNALARFVQRPGRLGWLCFLIGLQAVHHRLAVFVIAASFVVFVARLAAPDWSGWRLDDRAEPLPTCEDYWLNLPVLLAPLMLWLYFPIRAMWNPPLNWYDPDDLSSFFALISGSLYSGILAQGLQLWTQSFSWERLVFLIALPLLSYGAFSLIIVGGFIAAIQKTPWLGWTALALCAAHAGFVMVYPVGDWTVFELPALLMMTVPLAFGLAAILEWITARQARRSVLVLLAACLTMLSVMPLFLRWDEEKGLLSGAIASNPFPVSWSAGLHRFSQARESSAVRYADRVWRATPEGAPVLTGLNESTADNELYPLWYQRIVERRAPHSPTAGMGFLFLDWYRDQLNESLGLGLPVNRDRRAPSREAWIADVWDSVLHPLLLRGPVVTPSYPLPPEWYQRVKVEMVEREPLDRSVAPLSYQPFIPKGFIARLTLKPLDEAAP